MEVAWEREEGRGSGRERERKGEIEEGRGSGGREEAEEGGERKGEGAEERERVEGDKNSYYMHTYCYIDCFMKYIV